MKIEITRIHYNNDRGRVYFEATVDGKKKSWTVARGLFDVLVKLKEVEIHSWGRLKEREK